MAALRWGGDARLPGGVRAAEEVFRTHAGRLPRKDRDIDRVVLDGREVVFRRLGESGHPKVELIDFGGRFLEKITFLP